MTNPTAFDLANDQEFRHILGASPPPQPARVTVVNASNYDLDSLVGDDVLVGVALNGWTYSVGDIVYVLLAANEGDNCIILGTLTTADQKLSIGDPTTPDGPLTVRGDTGRFFFREADVAGVEVELIAAGQIGTAIFFWYGITDGTNAPNGVAFLLVPGAGSNTQNVAVGADTVQLRMYSTGQFAAIRTVGANTHQCLFLVLGAD